MILAYHFERVFHWKWRARWLFTKLTFYHLKMTEFLCCVCRHRCLGLPSLFLDHIQQVLCCTLSMTHIYVQWDPRKIKVAQYFSVQNEVHRDLRQLPLCPWRWQDHLLHRSNWRSRDKTIQIIIWNLSNFVAILITHK